MAIVNFKVSRNEGKLIDKIAARAQVELFDPQGVPQTEIDTQMDLAAVIAQGCPLRLQELLDADKFNFANDIYGIYRHLDRNTGKLIGFFSPRFSKGH